jgi:hypothetical protein
MESPRWLLLKPGRREQAVAALTRARGRYGTNPAAIEREISDIEASVSSQQGSGGAPHSFCDPQRAGVRGPFKDLSGGSMLTCANP